MARKAKSIVSIALLAALGLAAPAALADERLPDSQTGAPGVDVDVNTNLDMSRIDTDGNGRITKAEATAKADLKKQFSKLDENKDGELDSGEFAEFEAKGAMGTDDSVPGDEDKLGPGR